jgi:hypothetical protein
MIMLSLDELEDMENMNMMYKQCTMKNGNKTTTAWIPSKYAKVNKILKIADENGWKVIAVGSEELPYVTIKLKENEHKHHRKRTDL